MVTPKRERGESLRRELRAREVFITAPPDAAAGELRAAVCYPNSYRVAMACLGYQLVWGMFASHPAFRTTRFFASWRGRPPRGVVAEPRAWEDGGALGDCDVIAFSVYYEADYVRVYGMLAGAGIRPWAVERGEYDPLVILGGPAVTANAEPLAPFADAIVLGDAEESLPRLLDIIAAGVAAPRRELGERLAAVPGTYVPPLYRAHYGAPGTPPTFVPTADVPREVGRGRVADLTPYRGGSWLATPAAAFGKLLLLEPIRGCGRGCSFCATAASGGSPRGRRRSSLADMLAAAAAARVGKVGLVGAALADYGDIIPLAEDIIAAGFRLSVSSLALAAAATPAVIAAVGRSGQRSIALAPEGATAAMRAALGKVIPDGRLEECLAAAAAAGISRVKLYYIIGIPGETVAAAAAIGAELAALQARFRRLRLEARVNPLVPKRGTPLARAALVPRRIFRERLRAIKARAGSIKVVGGSWREARLQAVLARGERPLARWLARLATAARS